MQINHAHRALKNLAVGLGMAAACLGAAHAQQVGTYVGTTADGHEVYIEVGQDAGTGQFYIGSTSAGFTLNCLKTHATYEYGLGAGGDNSPVVDGHADLLARYENFYLATSYDFKGGDKIVGKIRGGVPMFADELSPPKAGQACNSINQKFTATFQPAAAGARLKAGVPQVFSRVDREGRRVIERTPAR